MKKIIFIIQITIAYFFVVACTSLEENPKGLLAPEGFFKTKSDVEAAIYGSYAEFVTISSERFFTMLMLRSDMSDIGDRNTLSSYIEINDFMMDSNNDRAGLLWTAYFQSISAANTAISAARKISEKEEVKKELEAKARFIRAYIYFHLVRCFGDIPYMDSPIESEDELNLIKRTPTSEVYDRIIDDLIFAKNNLPVHLTPDVRNIGTKGSAATVLSDVYLTLKQFENAAKEARYVIDNSENFDYKLEKDYQDLFNANLAGTLKEPIFSFALKNTLNDGPYNPTIGMVNFTRIRDYAPRSLSIMVPSLKVYQTWDDRDYRKIVCFEDSVIIDGVKTAITESNFRVPRPHIAKYYRYPGPQEAGDDRSSDHHYPLYRYADVLLIAAEAINELEGATKEAIDYLNQIRMRARYNQGVETNFPFDIEFGISTEEFRDVIREERRLEFAFEFKRWYDIKRWGILEDVFEGPNSLEPHIVDPSKDYLFPIPQSEVDVTGFIQNPGY